MAAIITNYTRLVLRQNGMGKYICHASGAKQDKVISRESGKLENFSLGEIGSRD